MSLVVERSDDARIWLALYEGEVALLRSCGRARATAVAEAPCSPCCWDLPTTAASAAADAERAALVRGVVEIDTAALGARSAARATPARSHSAGANYSTLCATVGVRARLALAVATSTRAGGGAVDVFEAAAAAALNGFAGGGGGDDDGSDELL